MKVLVVKTSSMGDVIHTFPAVTEALRRRRDLVLDWCVEPAFIDLVRLHSGIRDAKAAPLRAWMSNPLSRATLGGIRDLRRELRVERYDLVLDAQGLIKSAALAKLAGSPVAGYDRASAREGAASLLYDKHFAVDRDVHATRRTRLLFAAALGYEPDWTRSDSGVAASPAAALQPRAFLLHGTSRRSKEWSGQSWIAVAGGLVRRGMAPVVTWADEAERRTAEAIAAAVPETVVIPRSPLSVIAVEIGRAALVIGVDTGLMHLADAYRRPTIALFLGSSAGLTGPVGPLSVVLPPDAATRMERPRRRNAEAASTASVRPDEVLAAADGLLGGSHGLVGK